MIMKTLASKIVVLFSFLIGVLFGLSSWGINTYKGGSDPAPMFVLSMITIIIIGILLLFHLLFLIFQAFQEYDKL